MPPSRFAYEPVIVAATSVPLQPKMRQLIADAVKRRHAETLLTLAEVYG